MRSGRLGPMPLPLLDAEATALRSLRVEIIESKQFIQRHVIQISHIRQRLTTFNNVMITSHMAFLTKEALENIAATTFENIAEFESGKSGADLTNAVLWKD